MRILYAIVTACCGAGAAVPAVHSWTSRPVDPCERRTTYVRQDYACRDAEPIRFERDCAPRRVVEIRRDEPCRESGRRFVFEFDERRDRHRR